MTCPHPQTRVIDPVWTRQRRTDRAKCKMKTVWKQNTPNELSRIAPDFHTIVHFTSSAYLICYREIVLKPSN